MSKDVTASVIEALTPRETLIKGAIEFRRKNAYNEEEAKRRSIDAIKGFVKNNAASIGLNERPRCVDWEEVFEHFDKK